ASTTTTHHTEVEPDTFSNGSTIVSAFQVGRIYDGGACAIGFATSTNNGSTWTNGLLPGITKYAGGGHNDRATDAAVAYDASHGQWLVSSLTLLEAGGVHGNGVVTSPFYGHCYTEWDNHGNGNLVQMSTSTDGGQTWSAPATNGTGVIGGSRWC